MPNHFICKREGPQARPNEVQSRYCSLKIKIIEPPINIPYIHMKRKSSRVKIRWSYTMMVIVWTLVLSACTAMDAPEENNESLVSNIARGSAICANGTISETEALEYAKEVLDQCIKEEFLSPHNYPSIVLV